MNLIEIKCDKIAQNNRPAIPKVKNNVVTTDPELEVNCKDLVLTAIG